MLFLLVCVVLCNLINHHSYSYKAILLIKTLKSIPIQTTQDDFFKMTQTNQDLLSKTSSNEKSNIFKYLNSNQKFTMESISKTLQKELQKEKHIKLKTNAILLAWTLAIKKEDASKLYQLINTKEINNLPLLKLKNIINQIEVIGEFIQLCPLQIAIENLNLNLVTRLIELGAYTRENRTYFEGFSAIVSLAKVIVYSEKANVIRLSIMKSLLKVDKNRISQTEVWKIAIEQLDIRLIKLLFSDGIILDKIKYTKLLYKAVKKPRVFTQNGHQDQIEIVKMFIENGADINSTYQRIFCDGWTVLHETVYANNLPLLKYFL